MAILWSFRRFLASITLSAALLAGASTQLIGNCGPFTDVTADAFCPFVLEIFYLGITTGTTATTYDPAANVPRLQMAAFLSRTVDGVLKRGSRRAAMKQFWTSRNGAIPGLTGMGLSPTYCAADGAEIWVSVNVTMERVQASDGKPLGSFSGFNGPPRDIVVAMGRVLTVSDPSNLYTIDPTQVSGQAAVVATSLGAIPHGIAFDGARVWTANLGAGIGTGSVSIATPGSIPWSVTTVTAGLFNPRDALYDGAYVWVDDLGTNALVKLDGNGAVLQTVTVGSFPNGPVFDGANIWVPNKASNSVTVVKASNGAVLRTLTGNGLNGPVAAAFDGEKILVADDAGNSASLWKAADLTPLGFILTGPNTSPIGACSDGINFWVTLNATNQLARF